MDREKNATTFSLAAPFGRAHSEGAVWLEPADPPAGPLWESTGGQGYRRDDRGNRSVGGGVAVNF